VKAPPPRREPVAAVNGIGGEEADIVPVPCMARSRIAEPREQQHGEPPGKRYFLPLSPPFRVGSGRCGSAFGGRRSGTAPFRSFDAFRAFDGGKSARGGCGRGFGFLLLREQLLFEVARRGHDGRDREVAIADHRTDISGSLIAEMWSE